jgi:hypothetical protein
MAFPHWRDKLCVASPTVGCFDFLNSFVGALSLPASPTAVVGLCLLTWLGITPK